MNCEWLIGIFSDGNSKRLAVDSCRLDGVAQDGKMAMHMSHICHPCTKLRSQKLLLLYAGENRKITRADIYIGPSVQ